MSTQDGVRRSFIQLRFGLVLILCAFLGEASPARAGEAAAAPETVDPASVTIVRDRILIRTWLDGQGPFAFVLDTGAAAPIIDRHSAEILGLPRIPNSETGGAQPAVTVASMQLADAQPTAQKCITMDLSPFTRILGTPIVGVTGLPLGGGGLTLDVPGGRLSFTSDAGASQPAVPGAVATGKLSVDVVLNGGRTVAALIDTSFSGLVGLAEPKANEFGLLTADTPRLEKLSAAAPNGPSVGAALVRLESLKVGPVDIRKPVCTLLAPDARPVLGVGFLRLCSVTVAAGGARISIEPRTAMPYTDPPITGYGLGLVSLEGGYWTLAVAKGSPAAQSGAQYGDRLVQIDNEPMKDKPFETVSSRLVAPAKAKIQLVVERGGARVALNLQADTLL